MKHPILFLLTCWICLSQLVYSQNPPKRTAFLDKSGMDTTVVPGDDFFSYANGNWFRNATIPGEWIGWGVFPQLFEANQLKIKVILEKMAQTGAKTNRMEQQLGDFYASGMDTVAINNRGIEPLQAQLAKIRAIREHRQLVDFLVTDESYGRPFSDPGSAFIGYRVVNDSRQSTINRIEFEQGGLSLPERGYYIRTDVATQKIRTAFVDYAIKLFTRIGIDSATARTKAETILAFETRLAQSHKEPADLRDPVANYHKFAVADLTHQMPNLDWRGMLNHMGLQQIDTVLVAQPAYYHALDSLLAGTPISLLQDRLVLDLIDYHADLLGKEFDQTSFDFNRKTIYGVRKQPDRWKRIAKQIDLELSDVLGQFWVEQYFPPQAKERMLVLVNNIQQVYRDRIKQLDWMSPETAAFALAKLDKVIKKIGYPDQWKDYSDVVIGRNDYFGNVQRARRHRIQQDLAKVNRSVNRLEWAMSPPTVNAYANSTNNEIAFPAGILQFPYFDKDADDAINYGGIGAIIGHEITHLFDDQGRKYDANGNLRDWWTKQDAEHFITRSQMLITQYNAFTVLDSLHVNGSLTLGENLADLAGLTLAYQAFKLTKQGQSTDKTDGFTPDQRFFLSYAQIWRTKMRAEAARARIRTDPHAPDKFRVNGPLTNFAPFYRAFNVKPGQRLYKEEIDRTKVW